MKIVTQALMIAALLGGCASDPDYQNAKRLSETHILTAEEIGRIPPHQKFLDQQARFKELAAQPTPPEWAVGAKWRLELDAVDGHSSVLVLRVTDIPSDSTCMSGDWRRLEVVTASGIDPRSPAFSVQGRNLQILVSTGLCDAYDEVSGELSSNGFEGWRNSSGLFGSRRTARVTGRALPDEQ